MLLLMPTVTSAGPQQSDGNQFWQVFRQAVLDNNTEHIASMTRFPFEVRGVDDSNPIHNYDRKHFAPIWKKLLVQPELLPLHGKIVSKTMLELIKEKKTLAPKDFLKSDFIRVYDFEFELIKGHWQFTRAYLEE